MLVVNLKVGSPNQKPHPVNTDKDVGVIARPKIRPRGLEMGRVLFMPQDLLCWHRHVNVSRPKTTFRGERVGREGPLRIPGVVIKNRDMRISSNLAPQPL